MSYNLPPGVTQADVDGPQEWRDPIEGDYCEQNCGATLVVNEDGDLVCPSCDAPIQRHDTNADPEDSGVLE